MEFCPVEGSSAEVQGLQPISHGVYTVGVAVAWTRAAASPRQGPKVTDTPDNRLLNVMPLGSLWREGISWPGGRWPCPT